MREHTFTENVTMLLKPTTTKTMTVDENINIHFVDLKTLL